MLTNSEAAPSKNISTCFSIDIINKTDIPQQFIFPEIDKSNIWHC